MKSDLTISRLAIVGVMGSGKSTLAAELCELLSLKHLDLDQILWKEGDKRRGLEVAHDVRSALKAAEGPERDGGWVCEGNYKVARTEVWGRADVILYLDTTPLLRAARVLRREFWNLLQGNLNNVGRIVTIRSVSFWQDLFKSVAHASGLSYQQKSLRENLTTFYVDRDEQHNKGVQERQSLLAAADHVQDLQAQLEDLRQALQDKKKINDKEGSSQCICKIKEVSAALAAASKQAKAAEQLKVPERVPVVILRTQADIASFKLQMLQHQS